MKLKTMANNNNDLRDVVLNTSVVIEGIVKGRKTTKPEKALLIIERLSNTIIDLIEILKALNEQDNNT